MENFIENIDKEELKIIKENGAIDKEGRITEQGISLLACLEADDLYEQIEILYPGAMEIIFNFEDLLADKNKHDALLDIIINMYSITELEVPEYMDSLYDEPELLAFYTEEIAADWGDYLADY